MNMVERPDLSKFRVLVVDDLETNIDVMIHMLGKYKLRVEGVLSGKDAVQIIKDGTPYFNAIFMDYMMPGMDGMSAVHHIRAIGTAYAFEIPIIAVTAYADVLIEKMLFSKSIQGFIQKPVTVASLDSMLSRVFPGEWFNGS